MAEESRPQFAGSELPAESTPPSQPADESTRAEGTRRRPPPNEPISAPFLDSTNTILESVAGGELNLEKSSDIGVVLFRVEEQLKKLQDVKEACENLLNSKKELAQMTGEIKILESLEKQGYRSEPINKILSEKLKNLDLERSRGEKRNLPGEREVEALYRLVDKNYGTELVEPTLVKLKNLLSISESLVKINREIVVLISQTDTTYNSVATKILHETLSRKRDQQEALLALFKELQSGESRMQS